LTQRGYFISQFILSPEQFGIPNRRLRYYLLARSRKVGPSSLELNRKDNLLFLEIKTNLQDTMLEAKINNVCPTLQQYLELDPSSDYEKNKQFYYENYFKDFMKKDYSHHLSYLDSSITNCFTKSYGTVHKGGGSLLFMDEFKNMTTLCNGENIIKKNFNKIRLFTDREIANLMCFEKDYILGNNIKINYKLLGNSVNVKVVSYLLKYLLKK
jgi:tRNA (cytosine38-C5)-methyltransferase